MSFLLSMADYGFTDAMGMGLFGGMFAGMLAFVAILVIGIYVYHAFALMTIAKSLKHRYPWLAWIPGANIALWLQLGQFHWAWVFLMLGFLIPYIGFVAMIGLFVLMIISTWRVYEKKKYPGWLSLIKILALIPILGILAAVADLVILGLVAWYKLK
jgi:hypothetical protein